MLVHRAQSLHGFVGLEQGVHKRDENSRGHRAHLDLHARVHQHQHDHDGAQQIHERRGGHQRANPSQVLAQQSPRRVAKFADLEILHPESLHDPVAADRFFQNLRQLADARLNFLRGAPDAFAQRPHRPDHHRKEHNRAERHLPTGREQHGEQKKQRENVPETQSQILGKRVPDALDIVDDGGQQAPGLLVLKETDGLPDDLGIDLIPQVGDTRNSRVLHQHVAEKFRDALADEHRQNGNRRTEFRRCESARARKEFR